MAWLADAVHKAGSALLHLASSRAPPIPAMARQLADFGVPWRAVSPGRCVYCLGQARRRPRAPATPRPPTRSTASASPSAPASAPCLCAGSSATPRPAGRAGRARWRTFWTARGGGSTRGWRWSASSRQRRGERGRGPAPLLRAIHPAAEPPGLPELATVGAHLRQRLRFAQTRADLPPPPKKADAGGGARRVDAGRGRRGAARL